MIKKRLKRLLKALRVQKIYSAVLKLYDRLFSVKFECSIGDIILKRSVPQNNQLLLTSRLLDVEEFLDRGNEKFPYQNAISYKKYGIDHKEQRGNFHFKELIDSYMKKGYQSESYITCDKNLSLMDGNHRMGLHLYLKIENVYVRMVSRSVKFQYGGDWYYQVGIPTDMMEKIYSKYDEIQDWLVESGNTFSILLESNCTIDNNIIADIKRIVNVLNVLDKTKNGVFSKLIQFSMNDPRYFVSNHQLRSLRAFEIESVIKSRMKDIGRVKISKNCLEGRNMMVSFKSE